MSNFTYDPLHRLTAAYGRGYTYDAAGRLSSFEGSGGYGYGGTGNHPHAVNTVGGLDRYDYDANGNMSVRYKDDPAKQQTLAYTADNRLRDVTETLSGQALERYTYDADGVRISRTSSYAGHSMGSPGATPYYSEGFTSGAPGWTPTGGTWSVANGVYSQTNSDPTLVARSYYALPQSGPMVYEWTMTTTSGEYNGGMYILSGSGASPDTAPGYYIQVRNGVFPLIRIAYPNYPVLCQPAVSSGANQTHTYRVHYWMEGTTARFELFQDGKHLASCSDSAGYTSGSYIAVRTTRTVGSFDNVRVESLPPQTTYYASSYEVSPVLREGFTSGAPGWTPGAGSWSANGGVYAQTGTSGMATSAYRLTQDSSLYYEWKMKPVAGTAPSGGLYILAQSGTNPGNAPAYYVNVSTAGGSATLKVRRVVNSSSGSDLCSFGVSFAVGVQHTYGVLYHYDSGASLLRVYRDGVLLGNCVDNSGFASGTYLALRTDSTSMQFDDLKVERRTKYFQFGGQVIAMRKGGQLLYLHTDHLGSTLSATNTAGQVVSGNNVRYYAYGGRRGSTGTFAQSPTDHLFQGQQQETTLL